MDIAILLAQTIALQQDVMCILVFAQLVLLDIYLLIIYAFYAISMDVKHAVLVMCAQLVTIHSP